MTIRSRFLLVVLTLLGAWLVSGATYAAEAGCWPKDTQPVIRTNSEGFAAVWGCKGKYAWVVTGFVGRWSELSPNEITNATFGKLMTDSTDAEKAAAWRKHIDDDWNTPKYASLRPLRDGAIEALQLVNPAYRVKANPVSSTRPIYAFDSGRRITTAVKGERIADDAPCDCAYKAIEETAGLYCAVKIDRVALCVSR